MPYAPNGALIQPGYVSDNPFDTGRTGERNAELGGGGKDTQSGWDYDAGAPRPGATQLGNGRWVMPGASDAGGGGGGGDGSSIFGNPYFQQAEAAGKAASAADLADTKGAIQQLMVQFGLIPGNFQDKLGALDDTIRQLIDQNTKSGISQYARLLEGKSDIQRETINRLSARGLSRSGAKGYRLRRNTLDFERTLSDSIQAVLANVGGLQSGYASREYGRQMNLSQFLAQLFSGWRGGGGGGGGGASPVPQAAPVAPPWQQNPNPTWASGGPGTPTIGGGVVGGFNPSVTSLGGGSGTSSKKPLLLY